MIPGEVFKRRQRHNNTPQSVLLIITNFIVASAAATLFMAAGHINWFFWVVLGVLGVYNFFTIRRNVEEYNRITVIAYIVSLAVLAVIVFLFNHMA